MSLSADFKYFDDLGEYISSVLIRVIDSPIPKYWLTVAGQATERAPLSETQIRQFERDNLIEWAKAEVENKRLVKFEE